MRLISLAFLLGTCVLQQQPLLPEWRVGLLGLAVLLVSLLLPANARVVRAVVLVLAGGLGGYGVAAWRAEVRLSDALPIDWEWRDIETIGVVAGQIGRAHV